jgi:peptidyl-prolyl cis-trans isomerase D
MFEKLKRGVTKILFLFLFGILVLSFAVWGIGDVVQTASRAPIAEVGGTAISANEFTSTLQQRRQLLSRQLGQPISPEQSRTFGIDAAVLGEMVNAAAIGNFAGNLGMRLSDQTIADLIRADPAFHGAGNQFSRAVFNERIRQAGFTEQQYFAERRNNEIREQLSEALLGGVTVPDTLATIVHRYREETRSARFIRLDPAKAAPKEKPDEATLRSVYDTSKAAFTVPEMRHVTVLLMTPEALRERAKVTDDEVKAAWEEAKDSWNIPERRRIQQIAFSSKEEAEGEKKAIDAGKGFLMAALEANGAQGRVDQGLIARREISDEAFARAAFELPLNTVSEPVQIRGGWLLLRVSEIEPGKARSFDEVKDEVRRGLEEARGRELQGKLHDEIEDRIGASAATDKLKAVANELHLPFLDAPSVSAKGLTPDGKPAFQHPDAERFLASAFEGDATTPRETVMLADGGEAWIEVSQVHPSTTRPFEEVKAEAETLWREREVRAALTTLSQQLVDRIKAGTALDDVAKEQGLEIKSTGLAKRATAPEGVSPSAWRTVFTLPQGGAGSGPSADNQTRLVMVVAEIKPAPDPTLEQLQALRADLGQELQRDTLQTFITALRNTQGVKVNESVYKRAVGLDQTQ